MELLMLNPVISVALISWITAQILKTVFYSIKVGKFDPERITGAGGMPSAHSAMVMSAVVYTFRVKGVESSEFAFAALLTAVVIYDAMSVRYNAGLHARELNRLRNIVGELNKRISVSDEETTSIDEFAGQKKLTEFLGHKPIEVFVGSLLGALIAVLFPAE